MSLRRTLWLIPLVFVLFATEARADGYFGGNPDRAPSVFTYGYRGLLTGTFVGLAGGYVRARRDGFERDDWRPLVLGTGIGALAGATVGMTLGFVDLNADNPGYAAIALRDTLYGAGFGSLIGVVVGGLVIIRTREAEHALFGMAIGTMVGSVVGLGIGLIEGRRIVSSPRHARRFQPDLWTTRDANGGLVLAPGLSGRF